MALEIKLSNSWHIVDNPYSSSGVILEHQIKSKTSSKVRIEKTYHQSVPRALDFYTRVVIAKKEKKVRAIRDYLDEFTAIYNEGVERIEEAIKTQDTDK